MKPVKALKDRTRVDVAPQGIADRSGPLEPGKLADIIVVPGDPSAGIRQVETILFVTKEGAVYRKDKS